MSSQSPSPSHKENGNALFKQELYSEAISSYLKAIEEKEPNRHLIHSNISHCFFLLGDFEKAVDHAKESLKIDETFTKGFHRLYNAFRAWGKLEEAKQSLEDGLKVKTIEPNEKIAMERNLKDLKIFTTLKNLRGKWIGKVHEDMGDYVQEFEFFEIPSQSKGDDFFMKLKVSQKEATVPFQMIFDENVSRHPLLYIFLSGQKNTEPIVPYIFNLHEEKNERILKMCCPFLTPEIPKEFEGPGFVEMVRPESALWAQKSFNNEILPENENDKIFLYLDKMEKILDQFKTSYQSVEEEQLCQVSLQMKLMALDQKFSESLSDKIFCLFNEADSIGDEKLKEKVKKVKKILIKQKIIENNEDEEISRRLKGGSDLNLQTETVDYKEDMTCTTKDNGNSDNEKIHTKITMENPIATDPPVPLTFWQKNSVFLTISASVALCCISGAACLYIYKKISTK